VWLIILWFNFINEILRHSLLGVFCTKIVCFYLRAHLNSYVNEFCCVVILVVFWLVHSLSSACTPLECIIIIDGCLFDMHLS